MIAGKTQVLTGAAVRDLIRSKAFTGPTCGTAPGFVQANLAVIPKALAFEFLLFCQRNPKPCPILEVLEPGQVEPLLCAKNADIRTDICRYRIFQKGELVAETEDVAPWWREDLVSFLLGCSFSFEDALITQGIDLPYYKEDRNVPMFITNIQTLPAGPFSGPMVVSQRWIPGSQVAQVIELTSKYPFAHGAPIYVGDGRAIGIEDPTKPDFGDPWVPADRERLVPLYWACGVTPQLVAQSCQTELMITHAPGYMFVTDLRNEEMLKASF